jgi:hypothetical protein
MMELQKNLQTKESQILSLTSSNLSLTSTAELLKHQFSHITQINLTVKAEVSKLKE